MTLPNVAQVAVDQNGHFTAPWRNWLATLERALSQTTGTASGVSAAVAAIATALGSPDGTVENIPEANAASFVILSPDGTISVTGTPASGSVRLTLQQLTDSGVGAALYKITVDAYGRITGKQAAAATDVPYSNATSGLSATNVQTAIDAVAAMAGGGTTSTQFLMSKACQQADFAGSPFTGSANLTGGMQFFVSAATTCKGANFYWTGTVARTVRVSLWDFFGGGLLASVDVAVTGAGFYTATFATPVSLTAYKYYIISTYDLSGNNFSQMTRTGGTALPKPFYCEAGVYIVDPAMSATGNARPTSSAGSSFVFPCDPKV